MQVDSIPALVMRFKRIAKFCARFIIALGMAVLIGWIFDIAILKNVLPGLATMKVNTALCFLLAGTSLALANQERETRILLTTRLVVAAIVLLLGILTVGEYLFTADFGIDQLLFIAPPEPNSMTAPGRMALATAIGFAFTGLASVLLDGRRWITVSQVAAILGTLVGVLAVLGYVYGVHALYGIFAYSFVALHTAIGFIIINLGIIFSRPQRGLMAILTSNTSGGVMSRKLMPYVLTVPFLIGWLRVQGEKQGLYSSEFGVALIAITYALLFAVLIWRTAEALRQSDQLRLKFEKTLQQHDAQLTSMINSAMDAVIMIDASQQVVLFNPAAEQMFGRKSADLIGRPLDVLLPHRFRENHFKHIRNFGNTGDTNRRMGALGAITGLRANGEEFPIEASISQFEAATNKFYKVILRDITERKRMESDLRIAAAVFEAQVGIIITDVHSNILMVNQAFTEDSGYTAEEVVGKTPRMFKSGYHDTDFYDAMWESIRTDGVWQGEIWDRRKNGEIYPKWLTITAVSSEGGSTAHYVGTQIDITERKASEEQIKNLAFFDPLTKLPNRRLLMDRLKQALASSARSGKVGALLFIDLDNFKTLNDTLGHDIGDQLLQQVAQRLLSCVREGDTVARLGGDEFVIMLEDLSIHDLEAAEETKMVGEKILIVLNQQYLLDSHEYHNTPSIGATLFIDHQGTIDELFKQADIAMYQAKKAGRNSLQFYDPRMQESINTRAALEADMRKALENLQFHLFYQIQVDDLQRPIGAEALIRWMHPERGLITPTEFIPLAEETKLIIPIGLWVLETACAQLKAWQNNSLTSNLMLSVNVSAQQFFNAEFVDQVKAVIQRHAINPELLKLELTESMLLQNIEDIIAIMKTLKAIGIRFSLDDFGTGFSSLQYLKKLPLNQLKIDRSFVSDLVANSSGKEIVCTIIAMAHNLNLDVIAEGVETEEQLQFLFNAGCSHYQGYLFSKPVPIEQFEKLLE